MSEPYAAVLRARVTRPALNAYLEGTGDPASRWSDWAGIDGSWVGLSGQESDLDSRIGAMAAELDASLTGASRRAQWSGFLQGAEDPRLGHCSYDQSGATLTVASLTFTENLSDVLWFLALARGICDHLQPGASGVAVVRGSVWERETVAVAVLEPGNSRLVSAGDRATLTAAESTADAVFEEIWELASRSDPAAAPPSAAAVLWSLR